MKARDIEKKYPPAKAAKLIQALRARNLFYWDEDFPGDEEVGDVQILLWDVVHKDENHG